MPKAIADDSSSRHFHLIIFHLERSIRMIENVMMMMSNERTKTKNTRIIINRYSSIAKVVSAAAGSLVRLIIIIIVIRPLLLLEKKHLFHLRQSADIVGVLVVAVVNLDGK
jgi:hypothetical protein